MRTTGSPAELERRRLLAVERLSEGYPIEEVADFLGVDHSSVRRWRAAFLHAGYGGLAAVPASGRPPKLSSTQEKVVCRWLAHTPTDHGFAT
jgi:transposase